MIKLTQQQKEQIINTMWKNKDNIYFDINKNKKYGYSFNGTIKELNNIEYEIKFKNLSWMHIEYKFIVKEINIKNNKSLKYKTINKKVFSNVMINILNLVIANINLIKMGK